MSQGTKPYYFNLTTFYTSMYRLKAVRGAGHQCDLPDVFNYIP